jgi:hypothetical protein
LLDELLMVLRSVIVSEVEDGWGWRLDQGGEYSVKSTYDLVSSLLIDTRLLTYELELAFKRIWTSMVPTKVSGLVWMVLHDKVPTRENLLRRQVIALNGDHLCVLCGENMETVSHLFLYCRVITRVWNRIFEWLGFHFTLPHSLFSLLNSVAANTGIKKVRLGVEMIWCAVIWTVWNH